MKLTLEAVNRMDRAAFVSRCGRFFENSPWIAEQAWERRPFASIEALHAAMVRVVEDASLEARERLIRAHPDLVGRLAQEGKMTRESMSEQASAGLLGLSADEIARFERYNAAYKEKFGFPFVICARENRKDAILAAFPRRLDNSREEEIQTALREIAKIAWRRLADAVKT